MYMGECVYMCFLGVFMYVCDRVFVTVCLYMCVWLCMVYVCVCMCIYLVVC